MKSFNTLKLVSSFREMSNVLDMISLVIRVITFALIILQGVLLIKDTKSGFKKADRNFGKHVKG